MNLIISKIWIMAFLIHVWCMLNAQYKEKIISPQYLFKEFKTGNVFLKDIPTQTAPLNYNTLTQEMLFIKDTTILKLIDLNQIDSVVIDNRVFIPLGDIFYEIIEGARLKLLIRNKTRWDTEGAVSGYGRSKLAKSTEIDIHTSGGQVVILDPDIKVEIFDSSDYMIYANNIMLPASKLKNYISLFPDHEKVIRSIAKENKLNLNNQNDRIRFVLLINDSLNQF